MCVTCDYIKYENTYEKEVLDNKNKRTEIIHEQQLGTGDLLIRYYESLKTYKLAVKDDPKSEFVCNRCPTCGRKLWV